MKENENTLLIIKSQPNGLGPVEAFLKNRGWIMASVTNLKEAIAYIVQSKPAFIMVSVDHPNKKVHKLAKILAQSYPCCIITFAELSNLNSYAMLSESGTKYLIYPPVTGPSIERTVNKFYKDFSANPYAVAAERGAPTDNLNEHGVINIKGTNKNLTLEGILAQMANDEISEAGGTSSEREIGRAHV